MRVHNYHNNYLINYGFHKRVNPEEGLDQSCLAIVVFLSLYRFEHRYLDSWFSGLAQ